MTDRKKSQEKDESPDSNALALPSMGIAGVFDDLFGPFERLMQPFLGGDIGTLLPALANARQPDVELQDRGDHFSLTAELPGFNKDDVEVKAGPSGIEVKAERSDEGGMDSKGRYQRTSRSYFHQYLSLPEQVDADKIGGTMKNGVLQLTIPKLALRRGAGTRRVDLK